MEHSRLLKTKHVCCIPKILLLNKKCGIMKVYAFLVGINKCHSRTKKCIFALWCLQHLQGECGSANGAACDPLWAGEGPASSSFIQLPVQLGTWPWNDLTIWPAQDPAADPHPFPTGKTPHHTHSESTQPGLVKEKWQDIKWTHTSLTSSLQSIVAWIVHPLGKEPPLCLALHVAIPIILKQWLQPTKTIWNRHILFDLVCFGLSYRFVLANQMVFIVLVNNTVRHFHQANCNIVFDFYLSVFYLLWCLTYLTVIFPCFTKLTFFYALL